MLCHAGSVRWAPAAAAAPAAIGAGGLCVCVCSAARGATSNGQCCWLFGETAGSLRHPLCHPGDTPVAVAVVVQETVWRLPAEGVCRNGGVLQTCKQASHAASTPRRPPARTTALLSAVCLMSLPGRELPNSWLTPWVCGRPPLVSLGTTVQQYRGPGAPAVLLLRV
jgi:hypothetical protein